MTALISALPDPPSRQDPVNFASKGDALLGALPDFVDEANAMSTELNLKYDAAMAAGLANAATNAATAAAALASVQAIAGSGAGPLSITTLAVSGASTLTGNVGVGGAGNTWNAVARAIDMGVGSVATLNNPGSSQGVQLASSAYFGAGWTVSVASVVPLLYAQNSTTGEHSWFRGVGGAVGAGANFSPLASINSNKAFIASTTGNFVDANGTDRAGNFGHLFISDKADAAVMASNTQGGNVNAGTYGSILPATSTAFHLLGLKNGTGTVVNIAHNGNMTNLNNSYGAISDIKLKNIIGPAPSFWEKFKLVEFFIYTLKSDQSNKKQLGVIAQYLQDVFPGLVVSTPDCEHVEVVEDVERVVPVTGKIKKQIEKKDIVEIEGAWREIVTLEEVEVDEPLVDEYPLFDIDGQPVWEVVEPAQLDESGREIKAAVLKQKVHVIQKMTTVVEKIKRTELQETGTFTFSVNYSVLNLIASVVVQEAQLRVEELEQDVIRQREYVQQLSERLNALENPA